VLSFRGVNLCSAFLAGQVGLPVASNAQSQAEYFVFAGFIPELSWLGCNCGEHNVEVATFLF